MTPSSSARLHEHMNDATEAAYERYDVPAPGR